jgi:RNA 2',3'-cyclic 3'-phosphodiesterase
MDSERLRLFVAVDVPLALRQELSNAVERSTFPTARWTQVEGQHVTLKFLGWCETTLLEPICEQTDRVASAGAPFRAQVSGLGVFGSLRRASVLWAGIEDGGACANLARALDASSSDLGFEREARAFTPHLTLARFRPAARIAELPPLLLQESAFEVSELVLYRSHLSATGARYEALERFPLTG